jgi:hypothetical protein
MMAAMARPATVLAAVAWFGWSLAASAGPGQDADRFRDAVEAINAAHASRPDGRQEVEFAARVPTPARSALDRVLAAGPSEEAADALFVCGEAALDLADTETFRRVRERLLQVAPAKAAELGDAGRRARFLVRAVGGFADGYLERFADVFDGVLDAYDEVFGFREWSKVPGKLLRVRLHLVPEITRPPHFAPQFPYHSEIDFPVADAEAFRSPTLKGHMLFYGLCHELGHVIAMWGDPDTMEDHHAWAHYTGVAVVEHMAGAPKYESLLTGLRDARWRSLAAERKDPNNQVEPSPNSYAGVMALLIGLHDSAGPRAIGAALNQMDAEGAGRRVNRVRYYRFPDFEKALLDVVADPEQKKAARALFR